MTPETLQIGGPPEEELEEEEDELLEEELEAEISQVPEIKLVPFVQNGNIVPATFKHVLL